MEHKIDQIQKEVDELLRLCSDAGIDPSEDISHLDKFTKLSYLLLRLQDGDMDEHCFGTLEKWLTNDPEAFQYYVEFQNFSALLYIHFNKERQEKLLEKMKRSLSPNQSK
ncbi:MAG: hypothetical protein LLF76_11095 [Planctomycetaceae bacterium]|nr:hypothetical protein [Planctomycetaceae bacterium]